MTELSPAAQSILDSCKNVKFGDPCGNRYGGPYIAAALRAIVEQCVYTDDYATEHIFPGDIISIADELDGTNE